jgi:predicted HTH transcriptional regulator
MAFGIANHLAKYLLDKLRLFLYFTFMTNEELINLIASGEDSKTQLKLKFDNIDKLSAEIAAMANSEGGIIVVGVGDNGEIIGVEDLPKLNQWISNAASQKILPPIQVITDNVIYQNKLVVCIKIPLGTNKPYAVNQTDFWVKVGADKRRATREELQRLMQAAAILHADEKAVMGTSINDLNLALFQDFYFEEYEQELPENPNEVATILSNLKLLKEGQATLAGLLLFGKKPEIILPQFVIKAVCFVGEDESENSFIDKITIGDILSSQFLNTMAFFKRNLKYVQRNAASFNVAGELEIPVRALEEAVTNALLHRDYLIQSSIRIFIFRNRIEIMSPGLLPNTVTIENIKQGIQVARNPILLSFAAKLSRHRYEELGLKIPYSGIGTGIKRILKECKNAGIAPPEFIEDRTTGQFKVIFARKI